MVQSNSYYRVRWSEGMLVAPQHFQQWDVFQGAMRSFLLRPLHPYAWGVIEQTFDKKLWDDCRMISLTHFQGIFPHGTVADIPNGDCAPPARGIDRSKLSKGINIYLATPLQTTAPVDCPPMGGAKMESRMQASTVLVSDEYDPQNKINIGVERQSFQILFDYDVLDGYECLQIAQIRIVDGSPVIDDSEKFLPASLSLPQVTIFHDILQDLKDAYMKVEALLVVKDLHNPFNLVVTGKSASNYQYLWLASILQRAIPVLQHYYDMPGLPRTREGAHPEVVFRTLIELVGQLHLLQMPNKTPLPTYDHDDLYGTFSAIQDQISSYIKIGLKAAD